MQKNNGRWKKREAYTPKTGDIIFYDFEPNGEINHVGLVVDCKNGRLSTIEANTGGGHWSTTDVSMFTDRMSVNSWQIVGYMTVE